MRPGLTLRKGTDYIAIHCSASVPNPGTDVNVIDRWHRMRGFLMVGYHFVIKTDGEVQTGRPEEAIGAHVEGFNARSIGICMVGGVDKDMKPTDNFTPAQFDSLTTLLRRLKAEHPKAAIKGHRDFPNVKKACPSFDVKAWAQPLGLQ